MDKIKELLIGQWPDMRFTVGETNPKYGKCISIKQSWYVTRQSSESQGEWHDSEYTSCYTIECDKDGQVNYIYFNADNPDVVVVTQE